VSLEINCPSSGTGLAVAERSCPSCAADLSLLHAVVTAATTLARKAAQLAAQGKWQSAYDSAAESLRLKSTDNDLAAFVLLLSAFEGATGSVRAVPRPHAENLPDEVGKYLHDLLDAVEKVRSQDLPSSDCVRSRGTRSYRPLHLALATIGFLALGLVLGQFLLQRGERISILESAERPLSNHVRSQNQATPTIPAITQRQDGESTSEHTFAFDRELSLILAKTALADDWAKVARLVAEVQPQHREDLVRDILPSSLARRAYLSGLRASRYGDYGCAEVLLDIAMTLAPPDTYFEDDALYYRARALQRTGHSLEAWELFNRVLTEFPSSPYRREARRFLPMVAPSGEH